MGPLGLGDQPLEHIGTLARMPSAPVGKSSVPDTWWRSAVVYQIYVRSFADSNGDGHGDLQGVIDHLDHVSWLGVDAIWLSPVAPSPNADWGYDVSDYTAIDPVFGDLGVLDSLIAEAGSRGLRVIMDLVPNHTSDRHPWFVDARSDRSAAHRDWYVWSDGSPDRSPPNNWLSVFGGPAWTLDEPTNQYYLHNFLPEQPDLNWWNEEVREAFDGILRFWFDRGIAGLRIDVANGIVKDQSLRDDPPSTPDDHPRTSSTGLRPVYNMNRPEVHDVHRRWRRIADSYDPARVLIGETWLFDLNDLMLYYGRDDELHLPLNFPFIFSEFGRALKDIVELTERTMPAGAWPVWAASNHDVGRFATRWCAGDERKIRAALFVLMMLRGTPILYQGDEIGMADAAVPPERLRDPVALRGPDIEAGRDGGRTPMQWTAGSNGGFSIDGVEPWLPLGDPDACNVADQKQDPTSLLHLCRDLIAARREHPDLIRGSYISVDAPSGVWAWERGQMRVAVNCSDEPVDVDIGSGVVLIGTRREPNGRTVRGPHRLEPWEAILAQRADGA
jgi:alpha-glucosidase